MLGFKNVIVTRTKNYFIKLICLKRGIECDYNISIFSLLFWGYYINDFVSR